MVDVRKNYDGSDVEVPSSKDEMALCEEVLSAVVKALAPLNPDGRKRVQHAANAFYRVEK